MRRVMGMLDGLSQLFASLAKTLTQLRTIIDSSRSRKTSIQTHRIDQPRLIVAYWDLIHATN